MVSRILGGFLIAPFACVKMFVHILKVNAMSDTLTESNDSTTLSSTTKRRLVVVVAIVLILLACGLGIFVVQWQMVLSLYPDAISYGEVERGCTEIVYCYNRAKFYTHDTPETVDKYFKDAGLQLVAYGSSGGRSTFLYEVFDSGFINVGPVVFNVNSEIFINYDVGGEDETTIYQSSDIWLNVVR